MSSCRLKSLAQDVEEYHQVEPDGIEEMPKDGTTIDSGALGRPEAESQGLDIDVDQCCESADQVRGMRGGQDVEEGDAGGGLDVEAGFPHFSPGIGLPQQE